MKNLKVILAVLLLLALATSMVSFTIFSQQRSSSYEMYVNDQKVGVVKYAAKGLAYYDAAMQELNGKYPSDVTILSEVHFKEVSGVTSYTSESQLKNAMEKAIEIQTKAYAIVINDEQLCYVKTLQEAERLADELKKPYIEEIQSKQDTQLEDVEFVEELRFDEATVDYNDLLEEEEALALLQQSSEAVVEHTIQDDDTLWDIAIKNDISVDEILSLNPNVTPEKMRPGITIVLSAEKNLLNVITKEIIAYEEDIPFETEKRNDNTLLRGQTKTVQEGEKGTKEIEARIIRENGIEIDREVVQETVTKEPVKEIIAVGTKRPPTSSPSRGSSGSSSEPVKDAPAPSNGSVSGTDIVNYAKKFLGKPYVYAANGPNAFDCSGFTCYVYRQYGYSLYRRSRDQALNGVAVSKSNLAPGDILLFTSPNSGGAVGHVGIYIGGGQFIHASSGNRMKVVIDNLNSANYTRRYKGARRIIN